MFQLAAAFVRGEQNAAAGSQDPMELSQSGREVMSLQVDQRVERHEPAQAFGREG